MKKFISFLKGMSNEDALFLFSMFSICLVAFAFVGASLRSIDADIATWLIFSGIVGAAIGNAIFFVKHDFFFHDIK